MKHDPAQMNFENIMLGKRARCKGHIMYDSI